MGITSHDARRKYKFGDKVVSDTFCPDDFLVVIGYGNGSVRCRDRKDILMEFFPNELERYTP